MRDFVLGLTVSYLLGAIPTGYLLGKIFKGTDIRRHGSGNMGATNAFRVLGKSLGTAVLLGDILKGILATTVVADFFHLHDVIPRVILGVIAVIGHNWTIFLGFKGGKGIATSLGVLIGLTLSFSGLRLVLGVCVLSWLVIFLLTQYISVASMVTGIVLPLMMLITKQSMEFILLGLVFCVFILFRHQANLQRLSSGKEPKVPLPFFQK
ncbi:MAG: glycerol-3-phosphate 1-O-acyltransferase PlsY [Candidatus Omnitrophica bacterium]|nr:glycerol-3-phosphate 1-O-acyltransferase PlsY [Candidatus Omnitrophota bacterium]